MGRQSTCGLVICMFTVEAYCIAQFRKIVDVDVNKNMQARCACIGPLVLAGDNNAP